MGFLRTTSSCEPASHLPRHVEARAYLQQSGQCAPVLKSGKRLKPECQQGPLRGKFRAKAGISDRRPHQLPSKRAHLHIFHNLLSFSVTGLNKQSLGFAHISIDSAKKGLSLRLIDTVSFFFESSPARWYALLPNHIDPPARLGSVQQWILALPKSSSSISLPEEELESLRFGSSGSS